MKLQYIVISTLACLVLFIGIAVIHAAPYTVTQWTVDGVQRQAIIIPPSQNTGAPAPVVFVFHGHGGNMQRMARRGFQKYWPQAIVVCPQGLPTTTPQDPQGQKPGWQLRKGDYGDRDLKFFDAILQTLREKYNIDAKHIFVTGHSNGGVFTYLLWAERGQELAAVAPSSAPALIFLGNTENIKPLPVLHLAGEKDPIVPFVNQERSMADDRKVLGCSAQGQPWTNAGDIVGTIYPSEKGTPFVSLIHPGGHVYPEAAIGLIVKFFKECM